MGRKPTPWFWKERKTWMVTIHHTRQNLGPDKKAAHKEYYRLMSEDRKPVLGESVAVVLDDFLSWTEANRGERTYLRYLDFLQAFAAKYGRMKSGDLHTGHVTAWLNEKTTWNNTTKRNAIIAIQRGFNWAVKNRGLLRNPIAGMEKPEAAKRTSVVPPQEFESILDAVPDQTFRDLLLVAYDSGCRPQEVKRLEARHVELDKQRAVIPSAEGKGKIARAIYFPTDRSLEIITRLAKEHPDGPLFRNRKGNPWTRFAVKCSFDRLQMALGQRELAARGIQSTVTDEAIQNTAEELPKFRVNKRTGKQTEKKPWELRREAKLKLLFQESREFARRYRQYDFRHSFITRKLLAGVDSHVVAALAGHKDTKMIDSTYSQITEDYRFMLEQAKKDLIPSGGEASAPTAASASPKKARKRKSQDTPESAPVKNESPLGPDGSSAVAPRPLRDKRAIG